MRSIFVALLVVFGPSRVLANGVDTSLQTSISLESLFQNIISKARPDSEVRTNYLEGLLNSNYRINARIDEFEQNLDQFVKRAEQDPNFSVNPLESDAYQEVMSGNRVSAQLSKQVTYIYKRLLQTVEDRSTSNELRDKANSALQEIDSYITSLPVEDRIELSDLTEELRELRNRWSSTSKLQAADLNDEDANYPQLKKDLAATENIRARKSREAFKKSTPALRSALAGESQLAALTTSSFTQFHPAAGAGGNVIGTEFAKGVWALTFDDGPHGTYTPQLIDALNNHRDRLNTEGAPASFFWLAMNVKLYPSVVKKAVDSGLSTNCHSWSHANLAKASAGVRQHEINDAVALERAAFGANKDFKFFRCPYGACYGPPVPAVREAIAELGLIHAYWSVDSLDWKLKNAERTFAMITKQMQVQKHGVVLMHDIHPFSLEAAKMVLNWVKQQNNSGADSIYLYTIDDAVELRNKNLVAGTRLPKHNHNVATATNIPAPTGAPVARDVEPAGAVVAPEKP